MPGALALIALGACSEGAPDVEFHGEQPALADFEYDTGYQPDGQPVQARVVLHATGTTRAEAHALASGSLATGQLTGLRGSGRVNLDLRLQSQVFLKIDLNLGATRVRFGDPPMPVINAAMPNVDLQLTGQSTFDPFLVGGSARLHATAPATTVATIPLAQLAGIPAGVTGTLIVEASGTADTVFTGVCAAVDMTGRAQYLGRTSTTGALVLRPRIEIDAGGQHRVIGPFDVMVPIDTGPQPLDLGTRMVSFTGNDPGSRTAGGTAARRGSCDGTEERDAGTGPVDSGIGAMDAGPRMDAGSACADKILCGTCTPLAGCGWCRDTQECKSGSGTASSDGMCTGANWVTQSALCEGDGGTSGDAGTCTARGGTCSASSECCSTLTCSQGACVEPSTATCAASCGGCCSGNTCLTGTSTSSCGTGGLACVACPTSGHRCVSGVCQVDRNSTWRVKLISGDVPSTTPDGGAWDPFNGAPDPYVKASISTTTGATRAIGDTIHPVWNQVAITSVTAATLMGSSLKLEVLDDDAIGGSDQIGTCTFYVPTRAFAGTTQTATGCSGRVTVRYQLIPTS